MNQLKSLLVFMIVSLFLVSSVANAKPSFNPKGWFKGEKKGWDGESTPPGLSKKEAKKAEKAAKKQAKATEKEARKQARGTEKATEKAAKNVGSEVEKTVS